MPSRDGWRRWYGAGCDVRYDQCIGAVSGRRRRQGGCLFFFQAEDGIRDYKVTGVQTCALPILAEGEGGDIELAVEARQKIELLILECALDDFDARRLLFGSPFGDANPLPIEIREIGRASCRERV